MASQFDPIQPVHPPWPKRSVAERDTEDDSQQPPRKQPPAKPKRAQHSSPDDTPTPPKIDDYA